MNRKIDIYRNGEYLCSTTKYKTIKETIRNIRMKKEITIASIPDRKVTISDSDIIRGEFSK